VADAPRTPRGLTLGRIVAFAAVFAVLQLGWQHWQGEAAGKWVVTTVVVAPVAAAANLLTPGVRAVVDRDSVRAPGGGLRVLNGCEGFEVLFLLSAALLAAPARRRQRLLGFAVGLPALYLLSELRLLALFYAYRRDPALFDTLHGLVLPVALVAAVLLYFGLWQSWVRSHAEAAG
jgi:exosortase/archaeosortase family protein